MTRPAVRSGRQPDGSAVLALRRTSDLGDHAARARIVFAHGVLAEVDETIAVDIHAVTLWRVERADDFARPVDMDHRWRPHAAERERRLELRVQLDVRQIVRPVVDPDVVVTVDREACNAAHFPQLWQVFRPGGVEDELGHGLCVHCAPGSRDRYEHGNHTGK